MHTTLAPVSRFQRAKLAIDLLGVRLAGLGFEAPSDPITTAEEFAMEFPDPAIDPVETAERFAVEDADADRMGELLGGGLLIFGTLTGVYQMYV